MASNKPVSAYEHLQPKNVSLSSISEDNIIDRLQIQFFPHILKRSDCFSELYSLSGETALNQETIFCIGTPCRGETGSRTKPVGKRIKIDISINPIFYARVHKCNIRFSPS